MANTVTISPIVPVTAIIGTTTLELPSASPAPSAEPAEAFRVAMPATTTRRRARLDRSPELVASSQHVSLLFEGGRPGEG